MAATVAFCASMASMAHAENLLGNLPQLDDNGRVTIGSFNMNQLQVATKFTLPGTPYILDSIQLRLFLADTGGPVVVTIHSDDAGGSAPGTLIGTLDNPPLTDNFGTYTFAAAGVIRLEANTTYWFVVDHGDNLSSFDLTRSSGAPAPSGLATFNDFRRSADDGVSYPEVLDTPNFQINASEVVYQPDLSIGDSDKPGRAKKDNKYNTTAIGQKLAVKLEGRRKEKGYLFIQNDANDVDSIALGSNTPRTKLYRYKIFRLTGGKQNITAAVKSSAGFAFPDLAPGERITCLIELKGKNKRGNHKVNYTGTSVKDAAKQDANQLVVKPRI